MCGLLHPPADARGQHLRSALLQVVAALRALAPLNVLVCQLAMPWHFYLALIASRTFEVFVNDEFGIAHLS